MPAGRAVRFAAFAAGTLAVIALAAVILRSDADGVRDAGAGVGDDAQIEGFTFEDLVGDTRRLAVSADFGSFDENGNFRLRTVRSLEVYREGKPPLVVRADRGEGTGPQGLRRIRLEGGVEVVDPESGVRATLPSLEIDQEAGVARSLGEVSVETGTLHGRLGSVLYGLEERPTELTGLQFETVDGGEVRADRGIVGGGNHELDLEGNVRIREGGSRIEASRVVLRRTPDGRLERATVSAGFTGTSVRPGEAPLRTTAERGEIAWNAEGETSRILLEGSASVRREDTAMESDRIVATAHPGGGWRIDGTGSVVVVGSIRGAPSKLEASSLRATTDPKGELRSAEAVGRVRFRTPDASGEADRADLDTGEAEPSVVLSGADGRRARLAAGRTRIAADRLRTSLDGERITAAGQVEATLLPEDGSRATPGTLAGPFRSDEAVHFVSGTLTSEGKGAHLLFRRAVRGWQGDRHLAADEVELSESENALRARGKVLTRFPDPSTTAGSQVFVQVSAGRLTYDGGSGNAVYEESVEARLREGSLRAARLEVDQDREGRGIRSIRAFENVRFEYRPADAKDGAAPTRGTADRLVHDVPKKTIRLYGDRAPAEIVRPGARGGSTRGRVLRYETETGAVDVESESEGNPR